MRGGAPSSSRCGQGRWRRVFGQHPEDGGVVSASTNMKSAISTCTIVLNMAAFIRGGTRAAFDPTDGAGSRGRRGRR